MIKSNLDIRICDVNELDLVDLAELYNQLVSKESNLEEMYKAFSHIKEDVNTYLIGAKAINYGLIVTVSCIICKNLGLDCNPFMVIENFIVHKDFRNKRVGKLLIKAVEDIGKQRCCAYAVLCSAMHREDVHRFYENIGYADYKTKGFKKYLKSI